MDDHQRFPLTSLGEQQVTKPPQGVLVLERRADDASCDGPHLYSQRHFGGEPELRLRPFCGPDFTRQGQVLELRGKKSAATNGVTQSGKGRLTNRCSVGELTA